MPIIEVDHVTKEFQLGELEGAKAVLRNRWRRLRGLPVEHRPLFKALDDINISVEQGEVLGLIGHNGAGKSTLLKLLAGVSQPTSGRIAVRGRIAPLIEVSAGFVAQLTGRENVYLNGAILGMTKKDIDRRFDEIVDFAEVEEFIDTPVKRYSSGMKVKLAFAVATSIESEILIVDEVLAVGDLAFQRKCFDRMQSIIRNEGRTVFLVSHNIRHVERLCSRVIMLNHGKVVMDGAPRDVCDSFYESMNKSSARKAALATTATSRVIASGEAQVVSVEILGDDDLVKQEITSGDPLKIRVRFRLSKPIDGCEFHIGTHTTDFFYLTGGSSIIAGLRPDLEPGVHEVSQRIDSFPSKPGNYCIRFAMLDGKGRVVFHGENLRVFRVRPKHSESLQDELRIFDLPMQWSVSRDIERTTQETTDTIPTTEFAGDH
jgi:lipopolysaccharide transport system ATP-binding protein